MRLLPPLGVLLAATAVATALAAAAGAESLGTALTFGQIAFVLTLGALLLRG